MRILQRIRNRPRVSIVRRVGSAVAVVIVILLADLASTVWGILQLSDLNNHIQQADIPLRDKSDELLIALVNEETGLRGYLLTGDLAFEAPLQDGQTAYAPLVGGLRPLTAEAGLSTQLGNVVTSVQDWQTHYVVPALAARSTETASAFNAAAVRGKALFDRIRLAESQLNTAIHAKTDADFSEASSIRTSIMVGVIGRAATGVVLAAALLLLALRAILRPLTNLREVARALTDGRPISPTPPPSPPEFREVHRAFVAAGSALQQREIALADANHRLEEANRLKSEFMATMSHELRTPLNAILGFTDLVRSGASGAISAKTDDSLERVRRNGALLLELINDILDLSKIEAGRLVLTHDIVAIEHVARDVLASVQTLADAKGIALELHADDVDVLAIADRRAVKQILTNLVGNAVKFTLEGRVSVTVRLQGDASFIDVEDTGPGIVPDDQSAVFEPFRQVGTHARTGTGGTGLGLAIASRLARLMGGDIVLSSELGRGSRFTLRLPAVQGHPNTVEGDGPVILTIDDDPDALTLLQVQCERMGFAFAGVQQSSIAITAAATLKPAAILLDIVFPNESGWDVLNKLRADPRTSHIPVHVISVTDAADTASDAMVRFLQKPVSEDRLRAELEPYLPLPTVAV